MAEDGLGLFRFQRRQGRDLSPPRGAKFLSDRRVASLFAFRP